MQVLLESIRVEMPDFYMPLLPFHLQRMFNSQMELWNKADVSNVEAQIRNSFQQEIGAENTKAFYKCRLLYHIEGIHAIEWQQYTERQIHTLRLTEADKLQYHHKFADRQSIEHLKDNSAADDILMHRNGLITDISYANVAFFDGREWVSPEEPLLKGVKRASLLEENAIRLSHIKTTDLVFFNRIMLFNAMTSAVFEYRFDEYHGILYLDKR